MPIEGGPPTKFFDATTSGTFTLEAVRSPLDDEFEAATSTNTLIGINGLTGGLANLNSRGCIEAKLPPSAFAEDQRYTEGTRTEHAVMRIGIAIGTVISIGCVPIALAAAGNAEVGRQFVMRSCSSCHATEAAKTATDNAPPFSVVAKTNKDNPAWITGWLMAPHPPMPNISLSRQQIDDVVAYLSSLPVE